LVESVVGVISRIGALGAKTHLGCGVVENVDAKIDPLIQWAKSLPPGRPNPNLPSLKQMFFARVSTNNPKPEETTFAKKFALRGKLRRPSFTDEERYFLMGRVKSGDRVGSKVHFSIPYKAADGNWEYRCWGWVPEGDPIKDRNRLLDEIKATLAPFSWREYNSTRDKAHQHLVDYAAFLQSFGGGA
jgi:hypothetical protein